MRGSEHANARFFLACLVAVAVLALILGGTFDGDDPAPAPVPVDTTATGATTPATTPTTPAEKPKATVKILDEGLITAHTPSGKKRNRARLTLQVEVRNDGTAPLFAEPGGQVLLGVVNGGEVPWDLNAARLPEALDIDAPLAAGKSRKGEVRFELEGPKTTAVIKSGGALRIHSGSTDLSATVKAP
jgi:hypothetical protein